MFNSNIKSVLELIKAFPTEQSCIDHLQTMRWNELIISPFDSTSTVYRCKDNKYKCKNTGKYFNVRTGTIFDNTKIELQKWFLAIWLVTNHKKGISSLQLGRDLDITQKSAWFMLQRIRMCFGSDAEQSGKIVEVDETYIGGKNQNKSNKKRKELHANGSQTGGNHMSPVIGILERGKDVKTVVIEKGSAKGKTIQPILKEMISVTADVVTDGSGVYKGIDFNTHTIVSHDKKKWVSGSYHTNTLEGFWSLLKRSIYGIYHAVSHKHLQKYADEAAFRYNSRKGTDGERFNLFFTNIENRITYKQLINA